MRHSARDLANLADGLTGVQIAEAFLTAASPGVIALFLENQYYPTHEAYLSALAEAMKEEYDAIVGAGFLLQLDCPDLGVSRVRGEDWREDYRVLHIQALNQAVPTRRSCRATPPPRKKSRIGEDAPTPEIARKLCL